MKFIINPGTGPVIGACEKEAISNIEHFISDCETDGIEWVRIPKHDYDLKYQDGRYAFLLWSNCICHVIQMPGLPLDKVRFMNSSDQNIWDFPRLYVDDSSWVWEFAIGKGITYWNLKTIQEKNSD